ncbi:c-type cytochrome [Terriglobus sp. TAA 43]|uniref:c-type cytochrome n=1 Tax=Terriglobus sp. TAA 43 TaxID=278961 RepID=UPI0006487CE0|nr:c-type cytochrome [Terriglobus sp. TAA 43]
MSFAACSLLLALPVQAQQGQAAPLSRPNPYARKAVDSGLAEQGKNLFSVRCAFCHGSDARGGESGPNLLRSSVVLNDEDGEKIGEVVLHGRPQQGMPSFDLTAQQIKQIAGFLHSIPVSGNQRREAALIIPVGDRIEGEKQFQSKCSSCHSVTGDLKGIGARTTDPRTLQQTWMMPGMRGGDPSVKTPQKTVTVTKAGMIVKGDLLRIDDFIVRLKTDNGTIRSFTRATDDPKVVVHDPLKGHLDLLSSYTDKSIHDLTAYLVTLR